MIEERRRPAGDRAAGESGAGSDNLDAKLPRRVGPAQQAAIAVLGKAQQRPGGPGKFPKIISYRRRPR